ncbi:MAG TPA: ogr/Delta-like zinc finger family protein [Allosphingosinicella sp.]|jgi:hypothetical protein
MATGQRLSIHCPHCEQKARVRNSRAVSPTYKHLNFECTNFDCRHTFAAALEILYTIAPSARPNAELNLRTAPPRSRAAANDNGSAPIVLPGGPEVPPLSAANDDDRAGEAVSYG